MNAVRDPGARRPGRVAGLALVAIAALALVLGVITLVTGGSKTQGGGGQSSAPPPPASTGTRPKPTTAPPPNNTSTSKPAPPTSQPPAATTTTTATTPPFDPHTVPIRVLNNSTINGLAATAAAKFRNAGWNVIEVGNYPEQQGRILTTTAYFRPGTDEEPAAKALAAEFNMRPNERFPGIANASPGVIVILTNDFDGK